MNANRKTKLRESRVQHPADAEKDFEAAILREIDAFILEPGNGFSSLKIIDDRIRVAGHCQMKVW